MEVYKFFILYCSLTGERIICDQSFLSYVSSFASGGYWENYRISLNELNEVKYYVYNIPHRDFKHVNCEYKGIFIVNANKVMIEYLKNKYNLQSQIRESVIKSVSSDWVVKSIPLKTNSNPNSFDNWIRLFNLNINRFSMFNFELKWYYLKLKWWFKNI
jgi:hypothetical protein